MKLLTSEKAVFNSMSVQEKMNMLRLLKDWKERHEMTSEKLPEYIRKNREADRLELIDFVSKFFLWGLFKARQYVENALNSEI